MKPNDDLDHPNIMEKISIIHGRKMEEPKEVKYNISQNSTQYLPGNLDQDNINVINKHGVEVSDLIESFQILGEDIPESEFDKIKPKIESNSELVQLVTGIETLKNPLEDSRKIENTNYDFSEPRAKIGIYSEPKGLMAEIQNLNKSMEDSLKIEKVEGEFAETMTKIEDIPKLKEPIDEAKPLIPDSVKIEELKEEFAEVKARVENDSTCKSEKLTAGVQTLKGSIEIPAKIEEIKNEFVQTRAKAEDNSEPKEPITEAQTFKCSIEDSIKIEETKEEVYQKRVNETTYKIVQVLSDYLPQQSLKLEIFNLIQDNLREKCDLVEAITLLQKHITSKKKFSEFKEKVENDKQINELIKELIVIKDEKILKANCLNEDNNRILKKRAKLFEEIKALLPDDLEEEAIDKVHEYILTENDINGLISILDEYLWPETLESFKYKMENCESISNTIKDLRNLQKSPVDDKINLIKLKIFEEFIRILPITLENYVEEEFKELILRDGWVDACLDILKDEFLAVSKFEELKTKLRENEQMKKYASELNELRNKSMTESQILETMSSLLGKSLDQKTLDDIQNLILTEGNTDGLYEKIINILPKKKDENWRENKALKALIDKLKELNKSREEDHILSIKKLIFKELEILLSNDIKKDLIPKVEEIIMKDANIDEVKNLLRSHMTKKKYEDMKGKLDNHQEILDLKQKLIVMTEEDKKDQINVGNCDDYASRQGLFYEFCQLLPGDLEAPILDKIKNVFLQDEDLNKLFRVLEEYGNSINLDELIKKLQTNKKFQSLTHKLNSKDNEDDRYFIKKFIVNELCNIIDNEIMNQKIREGIKEIIYKDGNIDQVLESLGEFLTYDQLEIFSKKLKENKYINEYLEKLKEDIDEGTLLKIKLIQELCKLLPGNIQEETIEKIENIIFKSYDISEVFNQFEDSVDKNLIIKLEAQANKNEIIQEIIKKLRTLESKDSKDDIFIIKKEIYKGLASIFPNNMKQGIIKDIESLILNEGNIDESLEYLRKKMSKIQLQEFNEKFDKLTEIHKLIKALKSMKKSSKNDISLVKKEISSILKTFLPLKLNSEILFKLESSIYETFDIEQFLQLLKKHVSNNNYNSIKEKIKAHDHLNKLIQILEDMHISEQIGQIKEEIYAEVLRVIGPEDIDQEIKEILRESIIMEKDLNECFKVLDNHLPADRVDQTIERLKKYEKINDLFERIKAIEHNTEIVSVKRSIFRELIGLIPCKLEEEIIKQVKERIMKGCNLIECIEVLEDNLPPQKVEEFKRIYESNEKISGLVEQYTLLEKKPEDKDLSIRVKLFKEIDNFVGDDIKLDLKDKVRNLIVNEFNIDQTIEILQSYLSKVKITKLKDMIISNDEYCKVIIETKSNPKIMHLIFPDWINHEENHEKNYEDDGETCKLIDQPEEIKIIKDNNFLEKEKSQIDNKWDGKCKYHQDTGNEYENDLLNKDEGNDNHEEEDIVENRLEYRKEDHLDLSKLNFDRDYENKRENVFYNTEDIEQHINLEKVREEFKNTDSKTDNQASYPYEQNLLIKQAEGSLKDQQALIKKIGEYHHQSIPEQKAIIKTNKDHNPVEKNDESKNFALELTKQDCLQNIDIKRDIQNQNFSDPPKPLIVKNPNSIIDLNSNLHPKTIPIQKSIETKMIKEGAVVNCSIQQISIFDQDKSINKANAKSEFPVPSPVNLQKSLESQVIQIEKSIEIYILLFRNYGDWKDTILQAIFYKKDLEPRILNEKFTLVFTYWEYGLFVLTKRLNDLKNYEENFRLALKVADKSYYDFNVQTLSDIQDLNAKFMFSPFFVYKNLRSPVNGTDREYDSYVIYILVIMNLPNFNKLCFDLLDQIPQNLWKVSSSENPLKKEMTKKLLGALIEKLMLIDDIKCTGCILGKLIHWKLIEKTCPTILYNINKFVDISKILRILSTENMKGSHKEYLLSFIKMLIVINYHADKKIFYNNYKLYRENAKFLCGIDHDSLEFLIYIGFNLAKITVEDDRRIFIKQILPIISTINLPDIIKLSYLVQIYGKSLLIHPLMKLEEISACLSKHNIEKNIIIPQNLVKKFSDIFDNTSFIMSWPGGNKSTFWLTLEKNEQILLYKFITSKEIAPLLKLLIIKSYIKRDLCSYLEKIYESNQNDDIDFLKLVYIDRYDKEIVISSPQEFFDKFLDKPLLSKGKDDKVLMHFFEKILMPYFLCLEENQNTIIKDNIKRWKECISLNINELLAEFDLIMNQYDKYEYLQKRLQKIAIYMIEQIFVNDLRSMYTKIDIKKILNLKSIHLKQGFFEIFLSKLNNLTDLNLKKYLANEILNEVFENKDNSLEHFNSQLMERVTLILGQEITFDDIRDAVLKDPLPSGIYNSLLANQAFYKGNKVIDSLKANIGRVTEIILRYNITVYDLINIKKYDQKKFELMYELLKYSNQPVHFKDFFGVLFQKYEEFQQKKKNISNFLNHFDDIECIRLQKINFDDFMNRLPDKKISDLIYKYPREKIDNIDNRMSGHMHIYPQEIKSFIFPFEIEKFSDISSKAIKILQLPFFKRFLNIVDKTCLNDNELIDECNKAYISMTKLFNKIMDQIDKNTLTMGTIQNYFFSVELEQFNLQIKEIANQLSLKSNCVNIFRKIIELYIARNSLINFGKQFENLNEIIKINKVLLNYAKEYHQIAIKLSSQPEDILAIDYFKVAENLIEELRKNGITTIDSEDPVNKVIFELSTARDLIAFLMKLTKENINELKDYIDDQEEGYINRKSIKNLEYIWYFKSEVLDKSQSLLDFVYNCREFFKKGEWIHERGCDELSKCIQECVTATYQLERIYTDMNNKEASFKFRILEIMKECSIEIYAKDNNTKEVILKPFNYTMKQLDEFRDKALLIINSTNRKSDENYESVVDLETLRRFTVAIEALNIILESYKELEDLGFFQTFIDGNQNSKKIELLGGDFEKLTDYMIKVKEYTQKWRNHLDNLYNESYLLAHFYGRQLQKLHRVIMQENPNAEYIKNIALWTGLDISHFQKTIETNVNNTLIKHIKEKDPFDQLKFIKNLLEYVPNTRLDRDLSLDYDIIQKNIQPKVTLITVPKENIFFGMLPAISEDTTIKLSQILFCNLYTNPLEVTAFLHRAFLNSYELPHFLLGIEDLSAKLQNHFCDKLEVLLKILKNRKHHVNLVIVGSKTTEKIYHYLYHHKDFDKKVINNFETEKKHVLKLIKMASNLSIVISRVAGQGKTHKILEKCKDQDLNPIYFPLAGNLNKDRIGERFSKLKMTENTGLIIQIHNVTEKKILDEILYQLIFFRAFKGESYLFFSEYKFPLFIELQNLLEENYLQSIRSLSIFQPTNLITEITEVNAQNFRIDNSIGSQYYFVMAYLKAIKNGSLAEKNILYEEFDKKLEQNDPEYKLDEKECQALLDEYFFGPLKNFNPSYIQLKAFLEIFYSNLRTYSGSPFLIIDTLNFIFKDISQNLKSDLIKLLRLEFANILMVNSREFIHRNVSSDAFSEELAPSETIAINPNKNRSFSEQLRDFPLLIMRQGEASNDYCYSFVYNDVNKVPSELKIFILTQQKKNAGGADLARWKIKENLDSEFKSEDLTKKSSAQLLELLKVIAHVEHIKLDDNYAITLDNFYKMCLIIQRMRARIPIIIMGETGVGKTSLIRFLVENVYGDELIIINIHAGVNEKELINKVEMIKKRVNEIKEEVRNSAKTNNHHEKRLWVFFDEFNTTNEVGYISELLLTKRFMGELIDESLIFLGACNPFRKKEVKNEIDKVGIEKNKRILNDGLLYRVLPPPKSLIEVMWNYQELKAEETLAYIKIMLNIDYQINKIVHIIDYTHSFIKQHIEKSAVSLRDVDRFRRLYNWFLKYMPKHQALRNVQRNIDTSGIYKMERKERAFILSICFCYYMRLPSDMLRREYIAIVEKKMGFKENYMLEVLQNEQIELLNRMELPQGTALNTALRENIFSTFVCLMNRIPIIIVGMPGCSKSLSIRLLCTNLRGRNSYDEFFKNLEELSVIQFQGSESCTSDGIEKVFERAERSSKLPGVISTILFDEIGLAEVSVHNPLKALHSHLEGKINIAFIGISNWELDAAKMGRCMIVVRLLPDELELRDTAKKIFETSLGDKTEDFSKLIQTISNSYYGFIKKWRQKANSIYPDFFGLRDFYSLIKFISYKIQVEGIMIDDRQKIAKVLREGIERNFDGQANSINLFLKKIQEHFYDPEFEERDDLDMIALIHSNLSDPSSRCLLAIIRSEALIHMVSHSINIKNNNIITIHGSTFDEDKNSEEYNIRVLSDIINYIENGYIIIFKDLNNTIQTSLYDLYNKSYQRIGGKNYCRVAVGANYNPKCLVHPNSNCIVYINESRLSEIDPPFLNRFEKHYLTLDRFLGENELKLYKSLKGWLDKLFSKYLTANPTLKRENFMINISDEALASLCINSLQNLKGNDYKDDEELLEKAENQCQIQLLMNSTTDFKFLVEFMPEFKNNRDIYTMVNDIWIKKSTTPIVKLCELFNSKLIVFTYEQNISKNVTYNKPIKIIKMVQMKCEKDIKNEIIDYMQSTQEDLCIIKLDYETEIIHLSLVLFLIDNAEKIYPKFMDKKFIIILSYSRLAAAAITDKKPLQGISFLNGWSQIFLENLNEIDENGVIIEFSSSVLPLLDTFVNLKNVIFNSVQNSIKRFNFKFISEKDNDKLLPRFIKFLLEISNNQFFLDIAERQLRDFFSIKQSMDWRRELLNNKEITNMAMNIYEAITLYITEKVEDYLELIIKRLFESDTFFSLFPEYGFELLSNYIPDVNDKFKRFSINLDFVNKLIEYNISKNIERPSRAPNSIQILLKFPKLFPFSKSDGNYIFGQCNKKANVREEEEMQEDDDDNNNNNQIKDNANECLYNIALSIRKLEYSIERKKLEKEKGNFSKEDEQINDNMKEEEKNESQYIIDNGHRNDRINENENDKEIQFKASLSEFNNFLKEKTMMTKTDMDGIKILDMYDDIHKPENICMKELYLLDIRNMFIDKLVKVPLSKSTFLDRVIRSFLDDEFTIDNYLLVLLRGEAIWKNILQIHSIVSSIVTNQDYLDDLFLINLKENMNMEFGRLLHLYLEYVRSFFIKCSQLFKPNEINIQMMNGIKNYVKTFINTYLWLINLQKEFTKFDISIPIELTIWKNLMELIESFPIEDTEKIYGELVIVLKNNNQGIIFMIIDDFLEDLKKSREVQDIKQISKFQAVILFRFWLLDDIQDQQEKKEMTKRLITRINHDMYFADFCSNLLKCLMPKGLNNENGYDKLAQYDYILEQFSESIGKDEHFNNLSVIITDFFDKIIEDPKIDQSHENESEYNQKLSIWFGKFSNYWKIIETQSYNNHLQVLYIMGFFKHYLNIYAYCLLEESNYKNLKEIDELLSKKNYLADNLAIYTLKILRRRLGSFNKLKNFLFTIRKMVWIEKFEQGFKDIPNKNFFIPILANVPASVAVVQQNWNKLKNSNFNDQNCFDDLMTCANVNEQTRYMLLNIFLTEVYFGLFLTKTAHKVKNLLVSKIPRLNEIFGEYFVCMLNAYVNGSFESILLNSKSELNPENFNYQIIILNAVNWLIAQRTCVSPLTSLFFVNGVIPNQYSQHINNQFVITGLDNPYLDSAKLARDGCHSKGVYICSNECDFIYLVENCGQTGETNICPFCTKDIGNLRGGPGHTLGRVNEGARRILPKEYKGSNSLEASIDSEMDRIREKIIVRLNIGAYGRPNIIERRMMGYNRITPKRGNNQPQIVINRINKLVDYLLRLSLHGFFYIMIVLKWISPEEMLKVIPLANLDSILEYLRDNIQDSINKLIENLDCNDSIVWILAMQQMLSEIIQNSNSFPNLCRNRDEFEIAVEKLISDNLGENKLTIIRTFKHISIVNIPTLDSILIEEQLNNDYKFLKILRLVKLPSLNDILSDHEQIIREKYPIIDECIKNIQDMESVSKLVNLLDFTNALMRIVNFQFTRDDMKNMKIIDLITKLPSVKAKNMRDLLDQFLESWNSLDLGPIQYKCKSLGTMDIYTENTNALAFLIDSLDINNVYGKILSGVIHFLSEKQNHILDQIANRARNVKQLANIKLFDDVEYLPQDVDSLDILNLDKDAIEEMISESSASRHIYGNGVPVYNFERIQFNLIMKIIAKKFFLLDINLYQNVKFIGETFTRYSKYSDYITQVRRLGLNREIPDIIILENKFKTIHENQLYLVLKQVLGSLERLIIFYKNLIHPNVTLSQYVALYKFNAISKLITDEQPIRDYDISCIVCLYEWVEKMITTYIWKMIPEIYKADKLDNQEKIAMVGLIKKIKEQNQQKKTLPTLTELATAISRFASRCLLLGDFEEDKKLREWLPAREDFWPYPYDEEILENFQILA